MKKKFTPFDPVIAGKHLLQMLQTHDISITQWSAGPNGRAWVQSNQVKVPKPTDIERFCVAMHELGHCIKGASKYKMKLYKSEFIAEMFAIEQAEQFNWDVTNYKKRAKGYVIMCIAKGHCRKLNLDNIEPEIKKFCGVDFKKWKGKKVFVSNWGNDKELNIDIQ